MSVAPQPESPSGEMNQFFDQNSPEPPGGSSPEPKPVAAPSPATQPVTAGQLEGQTQSPDFWSEAVSDPRLPPSLQGKSRKEIWDANLDAVAVSKQAGFQKNQAEAQLQVSQAMLSALQRQVASLVGQQPQAPPHQRMGISDPNQLLMQPGQVLDAIPQYVDQSGQQLAQNLRQTEIAPLQAQLLEIQGSLAQTQARSALNMTEAQWTEARPFIVSHMMALNLDPRSPETWKWAAEQAMSAARKIIPQPQNVEVTPGQTGNTQPGVRGQGQPKRNTTGNRHIDAALKEQLDIWNSTPGVKKMELGDFADMIGAEMAMGLPGFTGFGG